MWAAFTDMINMDRAATEQDSFVTECNVTVWNEMYNTASLENRGWFDYMMDTETVLKNSSFPFRFSAFMEACHRP